MIIRIITTLFQYPIIALNSISGSIPLLSLALIIQTIIDKVIVQNSPDNLRFLIFFLIIITLVSFVAEIITKFRLNLIANNANKRKKIDIEQCNKIVKIGLIIFPFLYPFPLMSVSIIAMSIFAIWFIYVGITWYESILKDKNADLVDSNILYQSYLSIYYRFPIYFMTIMIFGLGTYLVLNRKLTLGQLISLYIISLELLILSITLVINLIGLNKIKA